MDRSTVIDTCTTTVWHAGHREWDELARVFADRRGRRPDPAARRHLDAVAARDADAVAAAFTPEAEVVGGVHTRLDHAPHAGGTTMPVRFRPGGVDGFRAAYRFDTTDGLIDEAALEHA